MKALILLILFLTLFYETNAQRRSQINPLNYSIYDTTLVNKIEQYLNKTIEECIVELWKSGYYYTSYSFFQEPGGHLSGIYLTFESRFRIELVVNKFQFIKNEWDESCRWDFNLLKKEKISIIIIQQDLIDKNGNIKTETIWLPKNK